MSYTNQWLHISTLGEDLTYLGKYLPRFKTKTTVEMPIK
jgi:hypothetical protein